MVDGEQVTWVDEPTLRALFETVVPADEWPGAWDGGVGRLLQEHHADLLSWSEAPLARAAMLAEHAASAAYGRPFAALGAAEQSAVVASLVVDPVAAGSMDALITVALQGYYAGTREPAGWRMVGYAAVPDGVEAVEAADPAGIDAGALADHYDVIVVGAGAGGGAVAAELSERGRHVLLIERARPIRNGDLRGNHLQGKRTGLYDVRVGPHAGNPRVLEHADGSAEVLRGEGDSLAYGLNAMVLGGGTRVWQGMSWRFWEQDFRMASTYGVPAGSTLADWPFGYEELEPYYERAEWELGVAGDADSAVGRATRRRRGYPMPAMPGDRTRDTFTSAAGRLGISASPIPFAINTVDRAGRQACVRCPQCIGHACPVDAKNGAQNTFVPRALATGRTDLLLGAQVTSIQHDGGGTASGVVGVVAGPDGEREFRARADRIIVAAGTIETARLLLASGLGNEWVGRNHMTHGVALAMAGTAPDIKETVGPGHSVATVDFVHHDPNGWGGGVIFDAALQFPYDKAQAGRQLAAEPFGHAHKAWMRDTPNLVGTMSMVQEIPHEQTRVSLDPVVTDRRGMPAARLRGTAHEATKANVAEMARHCSDWLEAAGGRDIVTRELPIAVQGQEHSAGTARLSADPADGACDPTGRLWGTRNVYVADASLHVTNGGFNPALTVIANALRVGALM
ncbi:GMC family oxidoreductase [Leifsonia sp. Leaf336]|uniref:GMC family oxidoreductase n=1 Tax=Leifsonia sp. Leaf336 TaxID=1736341 RepID=UPI0009E843F3|nr:GMC family oxidoreductase [Leifsonia sp. Leaf336]